MKGLCTPIKSETKTNKAKKKKPKTNQERKKHKEDKKDKNSCTTQKGEIGHRLSLILDNQARM